MMQTRMQSLAETVTNTVVGGIGAWIIVYLSMTLIPEPKLAATVSVVTCAVWSLARGYAVRRWFNRSAA